MLIPLPTFVMVEVPAWVFVYLLGVLGCFSIYRDYVPKFKSGWFFYLFSSLVFPLLVFLIWINPHIWEENIQKKKDKKVKRLVK